jgi:hypothetical protein
MAEEKRGLDEMPEKDEGRLGRERRKEVRPGSR